MTNESVKGVYLSNLKSYSVLYLFIIFQIVLSKYSIWKVNQVEHYFKRVSDTEWIETYDGIYFARFYFVEQNDDKVLIFKIDGHFYIELRNNSCSMNLFGKWII